MKTTFPIIQAEKWRNCWEASWSQLCLIHHQSFLRTSHPRSVCSNNHIGFQRVQDLSAAKIKRGNRKQWSKRARFLGLTGQNPPPIPSPLPFPLHPLCFLYPSVFVILLLLLLSWIGVPCQSLLIERYDHLRTLDICLLSWHQVCFIWVFPGGRGKEDEGLLYFYTSYWLFCDYFVQPIKEWEGLTTRPQIRT